MGPRSDAVQNRDEFCTGLVSDPICNSSSGRDRVQKLYKIGMSSAQDFFQIRYAIARKGPSSDAVQNRDELRTGLFQIRYAIARMGPSSDAVRPSGQVVYFRYRSVFPICWGVLGKGFGNIRLEHRP